MVITDYGWQHPKQKQGLPYRQTLSAPYIV